MVEGAESAGTAVELYCPACGGLIEAENMVSLLAAAKLHCKDAHGYDVPASHVVDAAVPQARQ